MSVNAPESAGIRMLAAFVIATGIAATAILLTERAVRTVDAWQAGQGTDDHLAELAPCLADRPELREQR